MPALRNARHEKYVQNLIAGMSQRQAYRDAFPGAAKWKDSVVDSRASDLFSGKVLVRYQEIQNEQKEAALLTRWEKRKILAGIARDESNHPVDVIRAIEADNRMENTRTQLDEEEQRARISQIRAQTKRLEREGISEDVGDDGFLDALNGTAAGDWADEEEGE